MLTIESKQMKTGKAFEYALLSQVEEKLKEKTKLHIIKNSTYEIAKACFESLSAIEKSDYSITSSFAINFLIDIEPRLLHAIGEKDILQLEILSDQHGKSGDVRDVLVIRLLQKWEIGISAKNNHTAVKHSRLSRTIDFGEKWLGMETSKEYFEAINPIFSSLEKIRKESGAQRKWSELGDYHSTVYLPILNAFIKELKNLYAKDPIKVSTTLVSYLVGNKDFYKVIKRKNKLEIHAYNINGTLNLPFEKVFPKYTTPKVPLPTEIIDISFKTSSQTTAIVTMNNNWILSFRIHNASSRVESSLKFDISLLNSPKSMFKNVLYITQD